MADEWDVVRQTTNNAKSMHFDGCHKIYLAMDEEQTLQFLNYDYEVVEPDFEKLTAWYDSSCGLRFVEAVYTHPTNPNAGFVRLIPQGYGE